MVEIKSKREIELMREACRVTALVHEEIAKIIRPGITTLELDRVAEKVIRENGGIPAEKAIQVEKRELWIFQHQYVLLSMMK